MRKHLTTLISVLLVIKSGSNLGIHTQGINKIQYHIRFLWRLKMAMWQNSNNPERLS